MKFVITVVSVCVFYLLLVIGGIVNYYFLNGFWSSIATALLIGLGAIMAFALIAVGEVKERKKKRV